jgi:hypothetical protein
VLRDRLDRHQLPVKRYCDGCEPQGACHVGDCPLREVSPLPLAEARLA